MTIDNETPEGVEEEQKSFFVRGALLGLIGGALVAVMLISVAGSVGSLFDELFGSSTAAAADEPVVVDPVVAAGEAIANSNGCVACHSVDGSVLAGPSWLGLGDRVDEEYILTSIIDPNAVIAEGFTEGIMPTTYADSISAEDLDALVAYLASL
ncbi:MAG: cytochrome c [Acidimicrobiia bacterium]|nr:cytochrome c [Acidimicrobiia bacterium]